MESFVINILRGCSGDGEVRPGPRLPVTLRLHADPIPGVNSPSVRKILQGDVGFKLLVTSSVIIPRNRLTSVPGLT